MASIEKRRAAEAEAGSEEEAKLLTERHRFCSLLAERLEIDTSGLTLLQVVEHVHEKSVRAENEKKAAHKSLSTMHRHVAELDRLVASLRVALMDAQLARDRAEAARRVAEEHVSKMMSSKTWRYTSVLRKAYSAVRRCYRRIRIWGSE